MKATKYAAFIPVRGGSKSIPLKNIKPMNGRPLVYWTIDAAVNCPLIDRVYVSTDSEEIARAVSEYNRCRHTQDKLLCFDRDPSTATDTASTESAMLDFAQKTEFSHMVLIQATSPLLRAEDLTAAIESYESNDYDSILSVVRQKRFLWEDTPNGAVPVNYDYKKRPRRQEFDGFLVENGAFYITSKESLLDTGCRLSGKIGVYEMREETYFEIDEPSDWSIIEKLLKNSRPKKDVPDIKLFVTDCDGVLTDGGMYYSENGDEMKKFNTKDGMGFSFLKKAGIKTAVITGENTAIVERRALKVKTDYVYQGVRDKLSVLKDIVEKEGIALENVAYIGDDVNDLECLSHVGLSFSVPNACENARESADVVTSLRGGEGAVREAIDYILDLQ